MELFGIRIRPEWPFHMTIVCFVSEQFLLWLVWRDQLPLLESFSQNPGKQRPKSLPVFFYSWIRYDPDPAILGRQLKVRITLQLYRIFKILLWSLEIDYRKKLWWLNLFKKTWWDQKNNSENSGFIFQVQLCLQAGRGKVWDRRGQGPAAAGHPYRYRYSVYSKAMKGH